MRSLTTTFFAFILIASLGFAAPGESNDYSRRILGTWWGPRKGRVFHADGRWGVLRNEASSEDNSGRRWHIEGNKLTLTYPGDHDMETGVYTIVSFTPKKFVTEIDGYKEEYDRSP